MKTFFKDTGEAVLGFIKTTAALFIVLPLMLIALTVIAILAYLFGNIMRFGAIFSKNIKKTDEKLKRDFKEFLEKLPTND